MLLTQIHTCTQMWGIQYNYGIHWMVRECERFSLRIVWESCTVSNYTYCKCQVHVYTYIRLSVCWIWRKVTRTWQLSPASCPDYLLIKEIEYEIWIIEIKVNLIASMPRFECYTQTQWLSKYIHVIGTKHEKVVFPSAVVVCHLSWVNISIKHNVE